MGFIGTVFGSLFTKLPVFYVTLDALGTLYKFRKPVSVQYLQVAQRCGLKAKVDLKQLEQAFKSSFKHHSKSYPNYGKGKLDNPEAWWNLVVKQAFGQLVEGGESALPANLGPALYKHFSSGAAYELFPDVKPFLQSMATIKQRAIDPDGPIVLTGIVTNSDPRVEEVLRDLGLRVGPSKVPGFAAIGPRLREHTGPGPVESIFRDYYNIGNDFDLISTSYEADAEKPESGIWLNAQILGAPTVLSRGEQEVTGQSYDLKTAFKIFSAAKYSTSSSKLVRIHVGDEYEKDYLGASNADWEAILLARGDIPTDATGEDVKVVRSLNELAMIVNVMANEFFEQYGK